MKLLSKLRKIFRKLFRKIYMILLMILSIAAVCLCAKKSLAEGIIILVIVLLSFLLGRREQIDGNEDAKSNIDDGANHQGEEAAVQTGDSENNNGSDLNESDPLGKNDSDSERGQEEEMGSGGTKEAQEAKSADVIEKQINKTHDRSEQTKESECEREQINNEVALEYSSTDNENCENQEEVKWKKAVKACNFDSLPRITIDASRLDSLPDSVIGQPLLYYPNAQGLYVIVENEFLLPRIVNEGEEFTQGIRDMILRQKMEKLFDVNCNLSIKKKVKHIHPAKIKKGKSEDGKEIIILVYKGGIDIEE